MHSSLLVERFVPSKVIRECKKDKLGLMMTAGVRSTSSWRFIFGGLMIALEFNWDEFVHYQRRANLVYDEAGRQFSVRSRNILMSPSKCPL